MDEELHFSPNLFCIRNQPVTFVMKQTPENEYVIQLIKHGGGSIVSNKGFHSVFLCSPKNPTLLKNEDVFSTEYIVDCCKKNYLLDIRSYRLNNPSNYPKNFNIMNVLMKQAPWPSFKERGADVLLQTSSDSDSGDDERTTNQDKPLFSSPESSLDDVPEVPKNNESNERGSSHTVSRHSVKRYRSDFTLEEEYEILQYLIKNNMWDATKGTSVWKQMACTKLGDRHTWQSLKERFRRKILQNVSSYGLSEMQVLQLKCPWSSVVSRKKKNTSKKRKLNL